MVRHHPESGNIIFFILLAVVLIGLVTAALRSGGDEGANVDKEKALLSATQVRQYAAELERAVAFILTDNNASEVDIRFAHPDAPAAYGNNYNVTPRNQVFSPEGGGAEYRTPPGGVNDGSKWQFYGGTALPNVGDSAQADLIAVLPNVTPEICTKINEIARLSAPPEDSGGGAGTSACVDLGAGYEFSNTDGTAGTDDDYAAAPNTADAASFPAADPVMEGCIKCTGDNSLHYFHVLHAR